VQEKEYILEEVVNQIENHLDEGCTHVGFVSPSHVLPQVLAIVEALRSKGRHPVFVYNSNGYDSPESLKIFEGKIDVYLPDLKYMDSDIAAAYSGAANYPHVAAAALKEMYRQKGSTLLLDDNGMAQSGLIIRHLLLPGHVENSKSVLRFIAEELSPLVHVSLMSQYYPTPAVMSHPELGRQISAEEYEQVVEEMENLGIFRGWIQEPESHLNYRPDFMLKHPFEP
jgi:putative pyruvate formate lyase activating enzyme